MSEAVAEQAKRGRGRPKGSRNRRREEAGPALLSAPGVNAPVATGLAAGVIVGPSEAALYPATLVRQVLAWLVTGDGLIEIGTKLRDAGFGPGQAVALLGEARAHLASQAMAVNRQAELGLALARLDQQYQAASDLLSNPAVAPAALGRMLAIQRERQALVGLGQAGAGEDGGAVPGVGDAQAELAAVAGHLVPLGLAGAAAPLREHARLAAYAVQRAKMERVSP